MKVIEKRQSKLNTRGITSTLALLSIMLLMFLWSGTKVEAASPLTDKKVSLAAFYTDGEGKGLASISTDFGSDYAVIAQRDGGIYLESTGGDYYRIRSAEYNSNTYKYYTVSTRGYIYLDTKANSSTFKITQSSNGYYDISQGGYPMNTYWSGGSNYITIGNASGNDRTLWKIN